MEGNGGALRFSAFTTELRLFNYFYESCFNYFTNLQLRAPRTTPTGADAVDDRVGAKGWRLSLSLSLSLELYGADNFTISQLKEKIKQRDRLGIVDCGQVSSVDATRDF